MTTATNSPICFGDVVKLLTKSTFVETSAPACLGFLETPGKTPTQILVVSPVKEDAKDRFQEAEFIVAPVRGEKQQSNGTPLTFQTPFVLRTSDGIDGSVYTLNNKVQGLRDAISLQVGSSKGEMFMQVENEGATNTTEVLYGTDGLSVRVVDSNRIRKTLNHLLTHVAKPKSDTPGGTVSCSGKGSALTFSIQRAMSPEGEPLTETRKYIKNPVARRASIDALSPSKMDQMGRAERVDSSEFSDLSRASSIASLRSNPASPRGAPLSTPVDAAAVVALLPTKVAESANDTEPTVSSLTNSSTESPASTVAKTVSVETAAPVVSPATPPKSIATETKTASPAPSPVKPGPVTVATPATVEVAASNAAPREPIVVDADASTFPPAPVIRGPAPAPVVMSPKTSSKPSTPVAKTSAVTKIPSSEEVEKLKAEAEVENVKPACAAECSVM